jgi:membrane protein implicated in regulation of membrane protease activity
MDTNTVGITLGTIGLLVGQVIDLNSGGWGTLIQGGAFAVLAYAFLHLIVKTLPQRDKDHIAAIQTLTQRHEEVVDRLAEKHTDNLIALATAVNEMRVHCARVWEIQRLSNQEQNK